MDLMMLNYWTPGTSYIPDAMIEGWHSLIWTERFLDHGDFELKTYLIKDTLAKLPEGRLLTLRDSREVMKVETREVVVNDDGKRELTVKGTSITSILNRRVIEGPYAKKFRTHKALTLHDVAMAYIWNSVVNTSVEDITVATAFVRHNMSAVPNTIVTDSLVNPGGVEKRRWAQMGEAWPYIRNWLDGNRLACGFRVLRPSSEACVRVTVNPTDGVNKGQVIKTNLSSTNALRWDVYNGTNRSADQEIVPKVTFRWDAGDLDNPKYLFSSKDFANVAIISSGAGRKEFVDPKTDIAVYSSKGLSVGYVAVDGGAPEDGENYSEFYTDLDEVGQKALNANRRVELFEGEVTPVAMYKFGEDYFLGDKVSLVAEYGFVQTMTVTEYIRTEDNLGERGWPGLMFDVTTSD